MEKYRIVLNREEIDVDQVMHLLSQTYWANDRTKEVMIKAIKNSECIAIYLNDIMVAFARIVTDYSTFFWLCDVIVDEEYRGKGLGKILITEVQKLDYFQPLLGVLATKDAFALYEKIGFEKEPIKFMMKKRF